MYSVLRNGGAFIACRRGRTSRLANRLDSHRPHHRVGMQEGIVAGLMGAFSTAFRDCSASSLRWHAIHGVEYLLANSHSKVARGGVPGYGVLTSGYAMVRNLFTQASHPDSSSVTAAGHFVLIAPPRTWSSGALFAPANTDVPATNFAVHHVLTPWPVLRTRIDKRGRRVRLHILQQKLYRRLGKGGPQLGQAKPMIARALRFPTMRKCPLCTENYTSRCSFDMRKEQYPARSTAFSIAKETRLYISFNASS